MKLPALCVFSLVLLPVGCAASDPDADHAAAEEAIVEPTHKPGVGICGVYETPRSVCVEGLSIDHPKRVQETSTFVDHSFVESRLEAFTKLGVSNASMLKAAVEGIGSIDASQQAVFDREFKFSKTSLVLIIKVEHTAYTEQYEVEPGSTRISEAYRKYLPTSLDDRGEWLNQLNEFRGKCGDKYLTAMTFGGSYFAMLEIDTEEEDATKRDEIRSKLQAELDKAVPVGGVPVKGGASSELTLSREVRSILSKYKYRLVESKRGGTPLASGANLVKAGDAEGARFAEILATARAVAADVDAHPIPIDSHFEDYYKLASFSPPGSSWAQEYFQNKLLPALPRMAAMARVGNKLTDIAFSRPSGVTPAQIAADQEKLGRMVLACSLRLDCGSEALTGRELPSLVLPRTLAISVNAPADMPDRVWQFWEGYPECYLRVRMKSDRGVVGLAQSGIFDKCMLGNAKLDVPLERFENARRSLGPGASVEVALLDRDFATADDLMANGAAPVAKLGAADYQMFINVVPSMRRRTDDVISLDVRVAVEPETTR